jgi:xanthine dehydrogenase accessory factor
MPKRTRKLVDVLGRERCVVVTLDSVIGSAPREAGCRMIVTVDKTFGSIGGGNLEFEATAHAQDLLAKESLPGQEQRPFALGPALNQCCGGSVTLLFECYEANVPGWLEELLDEAGIETLETADGKWRLELIGVQLKPLILFGAGHVGHAVARLLADLPFDVTWVDSRPDVFPDRPGPNINVVDSNDVLSEVSKAPPGGVFVVMTHSHQLDEDICFEVLSRGDFTWLGLIGSVTKRRRFIQRLAQRGIDESKLAQLVCPIGLSGIKGKQPATIALSLVAQLMHTR